MKRPRPAVVILGLDGASWELIDPLIASGRLPLFKQLKETAAWGTLRTSTPAKSPIIWTSIATGKTKAKHGVEDFRSRRVNRKGKNPITSSLDVREPMLWDMLGDRGLRSVLVNWYLSYPPQPLNGVNVSDFFTASALGPAAAKNEQLPQTVFPPERAAEFEKWVDPDYSRVLKRMGIPDYPALFETRVVGSRHSDLPVFKHFKEFLLEECATDDVAARLFRSEEFDLFAVYLELADKVQHFAYMSFVDDADKQALDSAAADGTLPDARASEAYAKIADILCPVYQNMERTIQRYFAAAGKRETYFIILSDHGFSFFVREGTVRYNHIGQDKAPDGIIIVSGPKVKPGKLTMARIYDIAPTVLYLLGLPLDRNMDGKPLYKLFSFRHDSSYTVYKRKKSRSFEQNQDLDEKALKELKALGYIN